MSTDDKQLAMILDTLRDILAELRSSRPARAEIATAAPAETVTLDQVHAAITEQTARLEAGVGGILGHFEAQSKAMADFRVKADAQREKFLEERKEMLKGLKPQAAR